MDTLHVSIQQLLFCCLTTIPHIFPSIEINLFSSRQEGGELADDVISPPHSGHQLPVPALPVGGA